MITYLKNFYFKFDLLIKAYVLFITVKSIPIRGALYNLYTIKCFLMVNIRIYKRNFNEK